MAILNKWRYAEVNPKSLSDFWGSLHLDTIADTLQAS